MKFSIMAAVALMILPSVLLADGLGISRGHNLDALWEQTQAEYDLAVEDAVLLLESKQVELFDHGVLKTRVHRVVWVGTSVGIRSYADLRIPWDLDTSVLDVEILRTWRDGRWWPDAKNISETAVVHTLPRSLDHADDYTSLRETMLLHDGVELGCIMETAYTITVQSVPGTEGLFVFPQADPAVLIELKVAVPNSLKLHFEGLNGTESPVTTSENGGSDWVWQSHLTPALRQPVGTSPEGSEPAVVWSTWTDWKQLASLWASSFDSKTSLKPEQVEQLKSRLHIALGPHQKAAAVGEYLMEMVRPVHFDDSHWTWNPRPASRTLETGYGHDLDRAILASALLKEAGLKPLPMFIGQGGVFVAQGVPRMHDFQRLLLRIPALDDALFDPSGGHLVAMDQVYQHPFWKLENDNANLPVDPTSAPSEKCFSVAVVLEKGEEEDWKGSGFFRGTSLFSHYSNLLASVDLKEGYLSSLASSVIPGLELSGVHPAVWDPAEVEMGLAVGSFIPSKDSLDRRHLVVGNPEGGILSWLPSGVHLLDESRTSPVLGMAHWEQSVTVRFEVQADSLFHKPEPFLMANKIGKFELTVKQTDDWLVLKRTLSIERDSIAPNMWPQLRSLLLEEADPAHGTIILK